LGRRRDAGASLLHGGAHSPAKGGVEYEVMETKPATTTGAVALLRFVAGLMEELFLPDDAEHEHYVGAIRNAADFFEGIASA